MKSAKRIAFEKWWFANRTQDNSADTEFSAYSFDAGYEAGWEACRKILNPNDAAAVQAQQEPVAWISDGELQFGRPDDMYGVAPKPLFRTPPAAAIPDGMVLVPREPTEEILRAMNKHRCLCETSWSNIERTEIPLYKAMIAAAQEGT